VIRRTLLAMHLIVEPAALAGAAVDIERTALGLEAAVAAFSGTAERCVPACGKVAYTAVASAVTLSDRAAQVLVADLRRIAGGLETLSAAYADLDRRLIPPQPR
jgi:hypothetical protein